MAILPEWAPNIHPMLVHFPIVLLILAILVDAISVIFRKRSGWRLAAVMLYVAGALAALATYLSGRQAADSVDIPPLANPTLTEHADLALYTTLFFSIYALIRLLVVKKPMMQQRLFPVLFLVLGAAGIFLLYETGEHGAELVFRHGVGVLAAQEVRQESSLQAAPPLAAVAGNPVSSSASWKWEPGAEMYAALSHQFKWWQGSPEKMTFSLQEFSSEGPALSLEIPGGNFLFTAGDSLKSVQMDVRLNRDEFHGVIRLVHHVQDELTYDFVELDNGVMTLGRVENGKLRVEDRDEVAASGWITIRAVGDGRHFRGYVNGKLVTHGHAGELPPGAAGLFIGGEGRLLIQHLLVQSLR